MEFDQFFEVKERFDRLVAEMNSQWMVYNGLFGNRANHEVLNQSGSIVWLEIRDALITSVLLGVGRLLDPAKMKGRDNLSIAYLVAIAPGKVSKLTRDKIDALKAKYATTAKVWRNRTIGHNDHRTAMGFDPLPELPGSVLGELVDSVNQTCNAISQDLCSCQVEFAPRYRYRSWVTRTLEVLRAGVVALPPLPPDAPREDDDES